jgi:hypothetical protein
MLQYLGSTISVIRLELHVQRLQCTRIFQFNVIVSLHHQAEMSMMVHIG